MFIPSSVQSILFEFEVSTAEKTSENTVPDELQAFMSTYFFPFRNPVVYTLKLFYKNNFAANTNGETDGKFCNISFKNETENQKRILYPIPALQSSDEYLLFQIFFTQGSSKNQNDVYRFCIEIER